MRYIETLLVEFDSEMKTTRTMLEQVPYETDVTKPSDKSRTMHELAAHLANIVRFGDLAISASERDFSSPGAAMPATYGSSEELLKTFDANVAASRAAIQGLDESRLGETFTLRRGEKAVGHCRVRSFIALSAAKGLHDSAVLKRETPRETPESRGTYARGTVISASTHRP